MLEGVQSMWGIDKRNSRIVLTSLLPASTCLISCKASGDVIKDRKLFTVSLSKKVIRFVGPNLWRGILKNGKCPS